MAVQERTIELVEGASQLCTFDFSDQLATGELVTGASAALVETPSGAVAITVGAATNNGTDSAQSRIVCPSGSGGFTFPCTVTVTTDDSNTKPEFWYLRVVEGQTAAQVNP